MCFDISFAKPFYPVLLKMNIFSVKYQITPLFDFQVCGGGPSLSLWHLRSLTATAVFDTPGACQQCVMFHEDSVSCNLAKTPQNF